MVHGLNGTAALRAIAVLNPCPICGNKYQGRQVRFGGAELVMGGLRFFLIGLEWVIDDPIK